MSKQHLDSSKKPAKRKEAQGVGPDYAPPVPWSAHEFLQLQQTFGNRAVGAYLQSALPPPPVTPAAPAAEVSGEEFAEEIVVTAPREAVVVAGAENSEAAGGEKSSATASAGGGQMTSDLGIPPEKLPEVVAEISSFLRAAEGEREERDEALVEEPAADGKVATVALDVPIDESLRAREDINYDLAVRAFRTLFRQYGIYLDIRMAGELYRRSNWTPLMSNAGVRAAVDAALAKKADTIRYVGQGMPSLVPLYKQIRAEEKARYAKLVEDLHKVHYAEDAIKSFYIAHWNGLIGIIGGMADLIPSPVNLVRSVLGMQGVKLDFGVVEALRMEYPGEYGNKYGGTLESGVVTGLMLVPGGALSEGLAAGASWLSRLVSAVRPGGVPFGQTLVKVIRLWFTAGGIIEGVRSLGDLYKTARQLISGQKELEDGAIQPLTGDDAGRLLETLIMQVIGSFGDAKSVLSLRPGAGPEAPPRAPGEAAPEPRPTAEPTAVAPPAGITPPEPSPRQSAAQPPETKAAPPPEAAPAAPTPEPVPVAPLPEPKTAAPAPEPRPAVETPTLEPAARPLEEVKPQPPAPEAKAAEPPAAPPKAEAAPPRVEEATPRVEEATPEVKPETPAEAAGAKPAGKKRPSKKKPAEPAAAEATAGEAAAAPEGPAPAKRAKSGGKRASRKRAEEPETPATPEPTGPTPRQRLESLNQERARLQEEMRQASAEQQQLNAGLKRLEEAKALAERKQQARERNNAPPEAVEEARREAEAAEQAWSEAEGQRTDGLQKIRRIEGELDRNAADIERTHIALDPAKHRALLPCFSGDTPVWTADGPRRIDGLAPGETVLAFDFSRMDVVRRNVLEVLRNRTEHFYDVLAGGGVVHATGQHLFWVESESDWVAARDLRPGMLLRTPDGRTAAVSSVTLREVPETASYNLSVEGAHNYFVGPGLLVHNEGPLDVKLARVYIIYRATYVGKEERFKGKTYIGQTTEVVMRGERAGQPRGVIEREGEHVAKAEAELARHAKEGHLTDENVRFYEFMKDAELKELVVGIETKAQADYLEQENIKVEGREFGEDNVMNRREQITSESHAREVREQIVEELRAQGRTCPP